VYPVELTERQTERQTQTVRDADRRFTEAFRNPMVATVQEPLHAGLNDEAPVNWTNRQADEQHGNGLSHPK
jgi:hypothetical protein